MPAPAFLAGLPKPVLFGLYGAMGGLLGAIILGEPAWQALKPPQAVIPPQVAVGASKSVRLYPGTGNKVVIQIARERFNGPVSITFDRLPAGVAIASGTIAANQTQYEASISAAADAPLATAPVAVTVTATAAAKEVEQPATTTFDLQVTAPPPAIGVSVPDTLTVYTKGVGKFTASIDRRGYDDEVAVKVDGLPAGITADPATIARGKSSVEVTLKAPIASPVAVPKITVLASPTDQGLRAAGITPADAAALNASASSTLNVVAPPSAPVDVVFVLDVTASIQWALGDLKNGIVKFSDALSSAQLNYRLGLVTFQDITTIPPGKVEAVMFGSEPFTSDGAAFQKKIGELRAEGGGDIPESSLEGVEAALKLPFRQNQNGAGQNGQNATKVILLITDAPPKVTHAQNQPQSPDQELAAVKRIAQLVHDKGIDSMSVVAQSYDKDVFLPLTTAGTLKDSGKFFVLRDVVLDEGSGFDALLATFGKDVTAAAMARSTGARPIIPVTLPPKVGDAAAPRGGDAPDPPVVKGVQASGGFAAGAEGQLTLAIGVWTGAIAALLCLALLSGQNHYLRGQFPTVARGLAGFAGGFLVGVVGGAAGQGLYMISPVTAFQVLGWTLLGGLAGTGLSLFIPNLKWVYGLAGGAIGGALGGLGYIEVTTLAGDLVGRLSGGLIVGFFIGLMVAIVEAAFRSAWLEVRYGARETITVNLGPEPVKVGGDAKACTVWARGAAPLALRFFIRDGQVICDDPVMEREHVVSEGFAKEVGNVTVTVHTGARTASAPVPSTPPKLRPAPGSKPVIQDDDDFGLPMPMSSPRAPAAASPSVPAGGSKPAAPPGSKPVIQDDDDFGLPMPMSSPRAPAAASPSVPAGGSKPAAPPVPSTGSRPTAPAAHAPQPSAPRPLAPQPPAPKPPAPVVSKSAPPAPIDSKPAPPAPIDSKPAPPAPIDSKPAPPKPAVPASPPAPPKPAAPAANKHPDACPGCGRINPGKPKARYCMVCDQTY